MDSIANAFSYITPLVWLDQLKELLCFFCRSEDQFVKFIAGFGSLIIILVAAFIICYVIYDCYKFFKYYIITKICNGRAKFVEKYKGTWVVVSGATDGIGLALSKKFAESKFPLIIISRNQDKLDKTQSELKSIGSPQVVTIQIDFAIQDEKQYARVERELDLDNRQIGCLINNVGVMGTLIHFHKMPLDRHLRCINTNLVAPTLLTTLILPQMRSRGFGVIVNVSTSVTRLSLPFFGIYGPAKSAINKLSVGLHAEYPELTIINLFTGGVKTNLFESAKEMKDFKFKSLLPTADEYASSVFNVVSSNSCGSGSFIQTTGCISHEFVLLLLMMVDLIGLTGWVFSRTTGLKLETSKTDSARKNKEKGNDAELSKIETN